MSEESIISKKDINKAWRRWYFGAQTSWNYETMQSGGVVFCLGPALRKIYKDDRLYKQALDSHFNFFNTNPLSGSIIMGATIAVEENHDIEDMETCRETATSVKTGLMGPLAGVGDACFFVIPMTIFGALAAYMAKNGSPIGLLFGFLYSLLLIFVNNKLFHLGYKQGAKFIVSLGSQLKHLTDSANMLGLMVVGALIGSTVKVNIPFQFTTGKASVGLQSTLDMITPNLIPAILVILAYWLLGKKGMTSTKIIFIILALSFLGYLSGLMA